ncbi:MAG: mechanosensitive ion channel [Candidatus Eisenbacteria bacterium]
MKEALNQFHSVWDFELFTLGSTPVTPATLATVALIIVVSLIVSRVVRSAITTAFQRRGIGRAGTVAVISRLTHYVILFSALGVALDTLGVDLAALFAAGAIFAIGIGFAMQTIAQNFVAGIILLVERSITPGDIIEVEGQFARVRTMGIRSTIVQTLNDDELIVLNAVLVGGDGA